MVGVILVLEADELGEPVEGVDTVDTLEGAEAQVSARGDQLDQPVEVGEVVLDRAAGDEGEAVGLGACITSELLDGLVQVRSRRLDGGGLVDQGALKLRLGNQFTYTMAHEPHFGLFAEESAGGLTGNRIERTVTVGCRGY